MAEEQGWHEGEPWMGKPRYECNSCSFDAMRKDLIEEHVTKHKPRRRLSEVLGPHGERIEVEEPAPKPEMPPPPEAVSNTVGESPPSEKPEEGEQA